MSLYDNAPLQITENDLQALILEKAGEGKTLDYKRDSVGQSDKDKKEFLYDVSSFANTLGGNLRRHYTCHTSAQAVGCTYEGGAR